MEAQRHDAGQIDGKASSKEGKTYKDEDICNDFDLNQMNIQRADKRYAHIHHSIKGGKLT